MILDLLKDNLIDEKEELQRKEICKQCQYYKVIFCAKCGCSISLKTKLKKTKCPIDKWGKSNAV